MYGYYIEYDDIESGYEYVKLVTVDPDEYNSEISRLDYIIKRFLAYKQENPDLRIKSIRKSDMIFSY